MDTELQIADHSNYSNTHFEPKLAVVVPIFRHSVLVTEAIESVLAQSAEFGIQTILVNDGCEFAETDQVCRDYQLAYPARITYLRKSNGGLSDARNHGIKFALSSWSSVEAIYLLDADNRLRPTALKNAMNALECDPNADWIYPNIDMIGLSWAGDFGGEYSRLIHSKINISEAGSLVRRRVFEAGVYFDTDFKSGFEDWDFFLSAAAAGFRGKNIENFGFLYRKRPDSMLAGSERERESILSFMRSKHRSLFTSKTLLKLEQNELPRYAIFLADKNEILLTVDPCVSNCERITVKEFEEQWWRTQTGSSRHHIPPYFVVTTSVVIDGLQEARIIHSALWQLERRTQKSVLAGLKIENSTDNTLSWIYEDVLLQKQNFADIFMVEPEALIAVFKDSAVSWLSNIIHGSSPNSISLAKLRVPASIIKIESFSPGRAGGDLLAFSSFMQKSRFSEASEVAWDWREPGIPLRSTAHKIVREFTGCSAAFPRLVENDKNVGFVLPLVEFGGVERVALNIAQALRDQGYLPHLFVLERNECTFGPEWSSTFESVTFLDDNFFDAWGPASNHYMGTDVPDWSRWGPQQDAVAMLSWLDVVINFHGGAISGIMGQLKRLGVKTALSLHLLDRSPINRPRGNAYLGLSFEHAYDWFLPCSNQLGDWLHGMGVPEKKIFPIPNAPSFGISNEDLHESLINRQKRELSAPLRILYLGRLDAQKGIQHLNQVYDRSRQLNVEWRVIGKTVLEVGNGGVSDSIFENLEAPLSSPKALAEAYSWADVMVLLSEYEGLPLTILEAMRQGVVVLSTEVGAIGEVLRHGDNGLLLNQKDCVSQCVSYLGQLSADREYLLEMSGSAALSLNSYDWRAATQGFANELNRSLRKAVE